MTTILLCICVLLAAGCLAWLIAQRRNLTGVVTSGSLQGLTRRRWLPPVLFLLALTALAATLPTHQHFTKFGPLHLALVAVVVTLPLALHAIVGVGEQHPRAHQAVLIALAVLIGGFTIFKFSYISTYHEPLYQVLPLNLCNLVAVMIVLRPFYRNKYFDNYLICFGLLGFLANSTIGVEYGFDHNFYSPIVFESNLVHNLFFSYCLYALLSREIRPDHCLSLANLYWLIPLYVVFIFTNQIWQYNFFFTSQYQNPIIAVYNFFPRFTIQLFGFGFEINLLYGVVVIAASGIILYLLAYGLEKATGSRPASTDSDAPALSLPG